MASGTVSIIPALIAEKLLSFAPEADLDELRYLSVPFFGYDGKTHNGELIVHKAVSEEVVEIFSDLHHACFAIEKMRLIEHYQADDNASMADNNSSAFCFRRNVTHPHLLSKHSYGLAIDINPLYNPYVKKDRVLPSEGKPYLDRSNLLKGMVGETTSCYKAFIKRGWTWGGSWPDRQDYQHFEKDL